MSHPKSQFDPGKTPPQLIEALRRQIARLEGVHRPVEPEGGFQRLRSLDRLLPSGGFRRGTLVEWLSAANGAGAESLAIAAAREACREGGAVVVIDWRHDSTLPPRSEPASRRNVCLSSSRPRRPTPLDARPGAPLRGSGGPAGLARSPGRPHLSGGCNWPPRKGAAWDFCCGPKRPWRSLPGPTAVAGRAVAGRRGKPRPPAKIDLLRCRHGAGGESIELEIDDETHTLHLASPLAAATVRHGCSRAS